MKAHRPFLVLTPLSILALMLLTSCEEPLVRCSGSLDCACFDDGTCNRGLRCRVDKICTEDLQEEACIEGVSCRPEVPVCYTPCSQSLLTADGSYRQCSDEGLMEGCLAGSVCDRGSCIPLQLVQNPPVNTSGSKPGACRKASDCPDFQTCIGRRCYSTCGTNTDCNLGYQCYRKVCRAICTEENNCNLQGYMCVEGHCLPSVTATPSVEEPQASGTFSLDQQWLRFSSHQTAAQFTINNHSPQDQIFTVSKKFERVHQDDGTLRVIYASDGDAPLPWLELGEMATTQVQKITVQAPAHGSVQILLAGARNSAISRWTGAIEVVNQTMGTQEISLRYADAVDGRWVGRIYTFGNFEDGARPAENAYPLDAWVADRTDPSTLAAVPNALMQTWSRFRNNTFSLDEMQALLQATLTGSWQAPRVKELCSQAGYGADAVCAPFGGSGSSNVLLYTAAGSVQRVPSGVVELDFALNLRSATASEIAAHPGCNGNNYCYLGKIDSSLALQYGGDPQVYLTFGHDPAECALEGTAGCMGYVEDFGASMMVGGRYIPSPSDVSCSLQQGLERRYEPWIIPGFTPKGVMPGEQGQTGTKAECRDAMVPYTGQAAANRDYAAANPVPDGRSRKRRLLLIDSLMIEQNTMLMLVREEIEPFYGGQQPLSSYAYVVLQKQLDMPSADQFEGNLIDDSRDQGPSALHLGCDPELVRTVSGVPWIDTVDELSHQELSDLARAIVRGDTSSAADSQTLPTAENAGESIHYVCTWREEAVLETTAGASVQMIQREVFNAGSDNATPCPPGASVVYFALHDTSFGAGFDPAHQRCNQSVPETCLSKLNEWVARGTGIRLTERDTSLFANRHADTKFDLIYRCDQIDVASCDLDRFDLRLGKTFLAGDLPQVFFNPIETEIREAFRYKTQFVSRTGQTAGFAPEICQGVSDLIPYCYDAKLIERIIARADCALSLYHHHLLHRDFDHDDMTDAATLDTLRLYLEKHFSMLQENDPLGDPVVERGFEHLNAELLIMLGDDSYTNAFAARFDLAGANQLAFDGDQFETGGTALSGGAGYEMYRLYSATQYYGMVLDRFYSLTPVLWRSIQASDGERYVTERTVTSYLERVARASTQNAAAWSEIARRYQALNRPDLARRVLERAYTRSHQESVILAELMTQVMLSIRPEAINQVIVAIEAAQRRYRVSLLEMQQAYSSITDSISFFGLPPDLVPFPALDEDTVNGFELLFESARDMANEAAEYEAVALESRREFDVDTEVFQSELVSLRNEYESQLGAICGTFIGTDGRVYPGIGRYAHMDPDLALLDDPCGATSNGDLYNKAADIQTRHLEIQRIKQQLEGLYAEFRESRELVRIQCSVLQENIDRFLQDQGAIDDMQDTIDKYETSLSALDKVYDFGTQMADMFSDEKFIEFGMWAIGAGSHFVMTTVMEDQIRQKQQEIRNRERSYEAYTMSLDCTLLTAELVYTLRGIQRDMDLTELDALEATWNLQGDIAELRRLSNERQQLEAQWADSDQMVINAAGAQNDPNIRIYKNDAIINADRTFQRALRRAYAATRLYEYYTSSSYAGLDKLFLVRMVRAGDINLSRYLDDLEDAFFAFEAEYGNPDTRVATVSVRDDIFQVPRYSADGNNRVLTSTERVELFRQQLASPDRLNRDGYISLPFSTSYGQLSPLTANHKILFIEVDIYGEDVGDNVGRIYLRQVGTGVVRTLDAEKLYYTFPARTAVMNPVFNGDRSFGQDSDGAITGPTRSIFRSYRFRDRPLVQTNWELVLNQRTESVNKDINLAGLDDIVVTIFYTDFTY